MSKSSDMAIVTSTVHTSTGRSQIKAVCELGKLKLSYDHELSLVQNHDMAARKLADTWGMLYGGWCRARMPDGSGFVYVQYTSTQAKVFESR